MKDNSVIKRNISIAVVIVTGAILKIAYICYTPVWCRQHDVIDFGAGEGHAAYIEYILANRALPDFDPRTVWAFFHPPLHHIIAAIFMGISSALGVSEGRIHENVQLLPLTYMIFLVIFTYLICKKIGMHYGGMIVTMLTVSFHPMFILMSGSLNNDALSVMLTVVAIYVAILWYLYPTMGKVMALAIVMGLAMSAKLSAAVIAPAIGLLMLYKMYTDSGHLKDRAKRISYFLEFAVFALLVIPLGLWWPVRNRILFDMPAGYIPEVGEHIEKTGFISTILDVRTASPFLYMKANGFDHDEYNLILATVKSALFDEGDFAGISRRITYSGWILFAMAFCLLVIQIVAMIAVCVSSPSGDDRCIRLFLAAGFVMYLISYLVFAIKGANLSAMNFRYGAAEVAILAVFAGLWYDRLRALNKKLAASVVMLSSAGFAAASALFYILIAKIPPG